MTTSRQVRRAAERKAKKDQASPTMAAFKEVYTAHNLLAKAFFETRAGMEILFNLLVKKGIVTLEEFEAEAKLQTANAGPPKAKPPAPATPEDGTIKVGDKVKWTSQAGGYAREKTGIVTCVLEKDDAPIRIAKRRFPNHKRMFDGISIPSSSDGKAYLVEVLTGPLAKPRLYMPLPSRLEKI